MLRWPPYWLQNGAVGLFSGGSFQKNAARSGAGGAVLLTGATLVLLSLLSLARLHVKMDKKAKLECLLDELVRCPPTPNQAMPASLE